MNKKAWKLIFVLTPLLMLVMTLYYSNTIIRYFEDSVYTNIKEEKMKAMNIFAHNIDELVNAGFSWELDGKLYDQQIRLYIEMLDSDDATHVALITKDFEIATDIYMCKTPLTLFEDVEIRQIIMDAIQKDKMGRIDIPFNGSRMDLFYQAIPMNDVEYWVVLGLDKARVIDNLDLNRIKFPIFIIGLLFVISTMDSIWQRIVKIRTQ